MNICFQKTNQRAFGTWPLKGDDLRAALETALDVGYRAIDTAKMYGNEAEVGATIAASGIPRDDLCVTTKVPPENFDAGKFIPSVEKSLADLQLDHVDILLLHWPPMGGDVVPPVKLLAEARDRGLAKNIGVSNFTARMLRDARAAIEAPIVTNQVEFHPLIEQTTLLAAASEIGIPLSAYCSVARGGVFKMPIFDEIAKGYGVTAGQVVLRWILQKGVSVNTMSTNPANIRANFDVMGFTLSCVDMARIDALGSAHGRIVTKDVVRYAPDWD